jgi:hypothetical protein
MEPILSPPLGVSLLFIFMLIFLGKYLGSLSMHGNVNLSSLRAIVYSV